MLSSLELYIKVIELGSFSAAGRVVGMTPSSVSRQMDKLEAEFGTRLLNRTTHTIQPTAAGSRLIPYADNALALIEQARQSVSADQREVRGFLRVSVFSTFGRLCICPLVPEFLRRHPQIRMALDLDDRMVDLHKENIDVAIRSGKPQDSSLKARSLLKKNTLAVASPQYLKEHGEPKEPDDLRNHNCLVLDRKRQVSWWHFRQDSKYRKVPVSGNLLSQGGEPLIQAALDGLGVVLLPNWIIADDVASGRLVPVLTDWQANFVEHGNSEIYAVFQPDRYERPALRAFIDYLVAELPQYSE